MLKLIVIDDTHCKQGLSTFVTKNRKHIAHHISETSFIESFQSLINNVAECSNPNKRLAVSTTESITLLNVNDIIRCESHRNYTFIFSEGDKKLIASKTLMEFEGVLQKFGFLRIHKSHLINVKYMSKYVKSEGGYVIMMNGAKLPVAVRKKEYLFRQLEKL
jgi:two-component system, LytTR family, response regulator